MKPRYFFGNFRSVLLLTSLILLVSCGGSGDEDDAADLNNAHSVARVWNEALLAAIRLDLARPTVHARNLFHSSALMYDAWAVFDETADTYFLGRSNDNWQCEFTDAVRNSFQDDIEDVAQARQTIISYGMYRLLSHRFERSPGHTASQAGFNALAQQYAVDTQFTSTDLADSDAAALGNYLADCIIRYGFQDRSNEVANYRNRQYAAVNEPLNPAESGTPGMNDPNRWQPLEIENGIDQSGNTVEDLQPFLGAEWGSVFPFALSDSVCTNYVRNEFTYRVCHDPGPPELLQGEGANPEAYQWNHELVLLWSQHLDPADGVMWDISPASIGNTGSLPLDFPSYQNFYNQFDGEVTETGHSINPATGEPYQQQLVPRGDYTRVLAEFWADGPDSETPPGHWFTIANEAVSDHPLLVRKYKASGAEISALEWDVKLYFMLGGAVHDAAITAWGLKGWYDYVRPISALRYMASLGQSSDDTLPNYSPNGLKLHPGRVELVAEGDPLAGETNQHVGKIKVLAWRGPDAVDDPDQDTAGVGWILAENWWPYQRPTFVTPPFAGYVSGHSTFSRAAAEVLTYFTGDPYFPGGIGEFIAKRNEFLVFEQGPSVDIKLQWATYRDASDQTSLSRIWGGIHPPIDDVPGRLAGIAVANDVTNLAEQYFNGTVNSSP